MRNLLPFRWHASCLGADKDHDLAARARSCPRRFSSRCCWSARCAAWSGWSGVPFVQLRVGALLVELLQAAVLLAVELLVGELFVAELADGELLVVELLVALVLAVELAAGRRAARRGAGGRGAARD